MSVSTNSFTKFTDTKGSSAWGGDNTSGSAYGVDTAFGGLGGAYGVGAYGGFVHFLNRTPLVITH